MSYARDEFGVYKVIGSYERDRGPDNLCIRLGDLKTGEFVGEAYANTLTVEEYLPQLIFRGDYVNGDRVISSVKAEIFHDKCGKDLYTDFIVITTGEYGNRRYSWKERELQEWVTAEQFRRDLIDLVEVYPYDGI